MKRKALVSAALALVLLLTFTAGAFGAGKPGPVYTTVQQVQTMIDTALAPIKADIADLKARLGLVETAVTANQADVRSLGSRVDALESATGGGDFWPVGTLEATPYLVAVSGGPVAGTNAVGAPVEIKGTRSDGSAFSVDEQASGVTVLVKTTFGNEIIWSHSTYAVKHYWDQTPPPVAEGTPVHVEYWVEVLGQRVHGKQTFSGWTYEIQSYSESPRQAQGEAPGKKGSGGFSVRG